MEIRERFKYDNSTFIRGDRLLEFYEGMLKIANVALALSAGYIAITLFFQSRGNKKFRSWQVLTFALVFFVFQEILGALRAFNIFSTPYLTHVNVSIILLLLIYALALQIYTNIVEK